MRCIAAVADATTSAAATDCWSGSRSYAVTPTPANEARCKYADGTVTAKIPQKPPIQERTTSPIEWQSGHGPLLTTSGKSRLMRLFVAGPARDHRQCERRALAWPVVLSSFDAEGRALSANELSAYAINGRVLSGPTDPDAALRRAAEQAGDRRCIVVLGSFTLVASVPAAVGHCRV